MPESGGRAHGLRAAVPLISWGLLLGACCWYLGYSAEKLDRFLPFERALVETVGRSLFAEKAAYDGTLDSVNRQDILIVQVTFFFLAAGIAYLGAVRAAFTAKLPVRHVTAIVLVGSALLRLVVVPSPPALETDHHRYLWDGAVTAAGMNPYQFAPIEVTNYLAGHKRELYHPRELERLARLGKMAREPALADHFRRVNHPTVLTVYPPFSQAFFALSHTIAPGSTTVLKALVASVDMAVVLVLTVLLVTLGRDPRWAIGYGWCPLILKEYAGTGHYDPLAILMVLVALHAVLRARPNLASLALAAGVLVKLFPLLLFPVLFRRIGLTGAAVLLSAWTAAYLPFLAIGAAVFDGLLEFGISWEFNSSLFAGIEKVLTGLFDLTEPLTLSTPLLAAAGLPDTWKIGSFLLAKLISGVLLAAVVLLAVPWRGCGDESLVARSGVVIAALLLLAPVADPWYFGWVAPFACLFPSLAAAWLGWSMSFYYFYFIDWRYLWWVRGLEYGPFYALLAADAVRWTRLRRGEALRLDVGVQIKARAPTAPERSPE